MNTPTVTRPHRGALFAFALAFSLSPQLQAFGPTGHRVVAQIAENHLTPSTQKSVNELLKGKSLSEVATWVEDMGALEDSKFWKKARTHWHSIQIPENQRYNKANSQKEGDAYLALETYVRVFKNPKMNAKRKAFALKFLTHVVGDLHQPIQPIRDESSQKPLPEIEWFGQDKDLSYVWEQGLIERQSLSFSELAKFVDTQNPTLIERYQAKAPIEWVQESIKLHQHILEIQLETLDQNYVVKHYPIVKTQLRKAGIRLAGVLNEIFDQPQGFDAELEQQRIGTASGLKR